MAAGCRANKAPLKCFMVKDTDSMIFQPTEDGKWSCDPFTIVKFIELLLQLHHSSRETVFMGKQSEARLTIDGWDKFLGMKFNANNGIGWSFPGNTTDFEIEDAVMEYNFKKIVGLCVDKVAAMEFIPNFELSPTLSDTKLTYLSEMINHPVKSFHWHDNEETTKFDKEF